MELCSLDRANRSFSSLDELNSNNASESVSLNAPFSGHTKSVSCQLTQQITKHKYESIISGPLDGALLA